MKELVVISGKGGTGKTTFVAAFAVLAPSKVLVDCDVDAANLHLLLEPTIQKQQDFYCGHQAVIRQEDCTACGQCEAYCRFDAVQHEQEMYRIDPVACEGCGVCVHFCPAKAIDFPEQLSGQWFISQTRCGPLVHASLGIAQENSGKLVALIRQQAKQLAQQENLELVIIDGAPGIGCPVIASLSGADFALVVTEPTPAGLHDMQRVLELAEHFKIPVGICINKFDLNHEVVQTIEQKYPHLVLGKLPYNPEVTQAQLVKQSIVEYDSKLKDQLTNIWQAVEERLANQTS